MKLHVNKTNKDVEEFTIGEDYYLDNELLEFDCKASIIHAQTLNKAGHLTNQELIEIQHKLKNWDDIEISVDDEDCHTAIENYLGLVGKKIHLGRSRNDQVLIALKLYEIDKIKKIKNIIVHFIKSLENGYNDVKIPGFTHMQQAMPTDVKTWLGCYVESMNENIELIDNLLILIKKSPFGSGAGYGVPIEFDKNYYAKKIGMVPVINPIFAQYTRAKHDIQILHVLTTIMYDLNKISTDLITFKLLGLVNVSEEFCTGSSIMPHKKNLDVLELIRAKYHLVYGNEVKYKSLISNLMSGYNRDMQLTKKLMIDSFTILIDCLEIFVPLMNNIYFNEKELDEELFATQRVYNYVKSGMLFRDAYVKVAGEYQK